MGQFADSELLKGGGRSHHVQHSATTRIQHLHAGPGRHEHMPCPFVRNDGPRVWPDSHRLDDTSTPGVQQGHAPITKGEHMARLVVDGHRPPSHIVAWRATDGMEQRPCLGIEDSDDADAVGPSHKDMVTAPSDSDGIDREMCRADMQHHARLRVEDMDCGHRT